ncbi:uncharacterized protein LOC131954427 [Physella acuta]|uniref:uncharacterized protein LOC131954427 n=1 Tax=Physella acuta TaxID=109671 RepID=UPI0027DD9150|nr:uncharacterized protein LOC131954427 [Physella acuta]
MEDQYLEDKNEQSPHIKMLFPQKCPTDSGDAPAQDKVMDSEETSQLESNDSRTHQQLTKEQIEEMLAEILANIKEKRSQDLQILADVKKEIMSQAEKACEMIERYTYHMHEVKGKALDAEVNKLLAVLEKIKSLDSELEQSKCSLNNLCQDIKIP